MPFLNYGNRHLSHNKMAGLLGTKVQQCLLNGIELVRTRCIIAQN